MDKLGPSVVTVGIVVLAFAGMYLGWRARVRRGGALSKPDAVPDDIGEVSLVAEGLYVATTLAREPFERVAVHGLGFRARCAVTVSTRGVSVALTGREPFFIPRDRVDFVSRGTWTIDKVVEPGGLVVLAWRLGDSRLDSYFRMDGGSEHFLDAASALVEESA